jgi:hypothetical protein
LKKYTQDFAKHSVVAEDWKTALESKNQNHFQLMLNELYPIMEDAEDEELSLQASQLITLATSIISYLQSSFLYEPTTWMAYDGTYRVMVHALGAIDMILHFRGDDFDVEKSFMFWADLGIIDLFEQLIKC